VVASTTALDIYGDLHVYGITFRFTGASSVSMNISTTGNGAAVWDNCRFELNTGSSPMSLGTRGGTAVYGRVTFRNCTMKYASVNNVTCLGRGETTFIGCTIPDSGSTAFPTKLFYNDTTYGAAAGGRHLFIGCDFSALGASKTLFDGGQSPVTWRLIGCKISSSLGTLYGAASGPGAGVLIGTSTDPAGANNNYAYFVRSYLGNIDIDTNQYITLATEGGSADEAVSYSLKVVGNSGTKEFGPLRTEWIQIRYGGTTGSSKTAAIEILYDGAANLQDNEVWMELCYLADTGDTLAGYVNDKRVSTSAAADQIAGIGTSHWTKGTATTGWISQKLSVAFTPNKKGYLMARAVLGANKTIYVNPNIVVT
jgi:hypothetical protein